MSKSQGFQAGEPFEIREGQGSDVTVVSLAGELDFGTSYDDAKPE